VDEKLNNNGIMTAIAKQSNTPLINTPLQRGGRVRVREENRFNGFYREGERK
jgi:hypothetical protein